MTASALKRFGLFAMPFIFFDTAWGAVVPKNPYSVLRAYEDVDEALAAYRLCAQGPEKSTLAMINEISPVRQKLITYYGEIKVEIHERALSWAEPTTCREVGANEHDLRRRFKNNLSSLRRLILFLN